MKILIVDMSEMLGNINKRFIVFGIVIFGTIFFSTFWRLWKVVFWRKSFKNLISMFSFCPKNGITGSRKTSKTQAWLVVHWVTFSTFCPLVYDIPSFEWFDFGLRYLVKVMLKGQPAKFKDSLSNFPISETCSRCNSVFRQNCFQN